MTKRRAPRASLTPEAVALFQLCEEYAGRETMRTEWLQACKSLRQMCGLPPWSFNPADPILDGAMPDYATHLASAQTWEPARALRRALQAAAAARP
jgi:hypothetical protein